MHVHTCKCMSASGKSHYYWLIDDVTVDKYLSEIWGGVKLEMKKNRLISIRVECNRETTTTLTISSYLELTLSMMHHNSLEAHTGRMSQTI